MKYPNPIAQSLKSTNLLILGLTILVISYFGCSNSDTLSGGTTIGNPHTVSGVIVDSLGNGVSNIKVVLFPSNYNPLSDVYPDSSAITDDSGVYVIEDVYDGKYVLNAIDKNCKKRVYNSVLIDGNDEDLGEDTVKNMGVISVHLTPREYAEGRFIYIPGTDLYTPVSDTGYNYIVAPAGRVNLAYYDTSGGGSIIDEGPNYTYIPVTSGDTITINSHEITMADKPEGPTSPKVGDTCTYLIRNAKTSLSHPIEYRFRYVEYVSVPGDWWVNSDTTAWSQNASIIKVWPKAAEYKIQAQVRSTVDTTVISTFYPTSNYLKVLVTDTL